MCSALTPADFTSAGVPVSRLREANLDDDKSAYCIYDGDKAKVELDIFYPAGDTASGAQNAVRAAQGSIGGKFQPVHVAGADEAASNAPGTDSASIVVRKGTAVFNLSIPKNPQAQAQLVKLSETVTSRLRK